MQQSLRKQVSHLQSYIAQLQQTFQNNIQVIEQRQSQIEELGAKISQLQEHRHMLEMRVEECEMEKEGDVRRIQGEYQRVLEEKEREMEEIGVAIQGKLRKEIQNVKHKLQQQITQLKHNNVQHEETHKRLLAESQRQQELIKTQKTQLLEYESQLNLLSQEKHSYASKLSLHLQELQTLKSSQQAWEDTLKGKVKEAHLDKQKLEEEISELKLGFKDKIKRQKQQFTKKIIAMAEEKEKIIRQASMEMRQVKYKLEKNQQEVRQMTLEIQMLKQQRKKDEALLNKYKQNQMKSGFEKNHKEYEMLQKMFDQNARDLKLQIESLTEEKKSMKQELQEANQKRLAAEKAIQRVSMQLLHEKKEVDQMKKSKNKIKTELEARICQLEQQLQQQPFQQVPSQQVNRPEMGDSGGVRLDMDYSKVYTEDPGFIDERYFQAASPLRSPKHSPINKPSVGNNFQSNILNRQAQYLKKISQLQLQTQQYKNIIKALKQQLQSLRFKCEEDKSKEISIYRDKANVYWEKANDKEQQLMALREQYNELKGNYGQVCREIKEIKSNEDKNKTQREEVIRMKEVLMKIQEENQGLKEEIEMLENERTMLEDVSASLRAEIHSLKQLLNTDISYQPDPQIYNQNSSQYTETAPIAPLRPENPSATFQREGFRHKIPQKLHALVKQKKTLAISGRQAALSHKLPDVRLEHIGTDSQKEVYQKLKVKNRTPPKVANYAEMRDKQRRTTLIQTNSQKQAYERLRARNGVSPQRGPDRGVNYLQMRSQDHIQ